VGYRAPVGGSPAEVAEFPHIVRKTAKDFFFLGFTYFFLEAALGWIQDDNTTLWDCGGILITEVFVLTAGHCTYSKRFEYFFY
jgi:secreted trypsin-like serine protease